jgi:hypothetical protein
MLMTQPFDFIKKAYSGDTFKLEFEVTEDDAPDNLTGATVNFELGDIDQDTEGVVITVDGPAGSALIKIPHTLMQTLETPKLYPMPVQVVYADTTRETVLYIGVDLRVGISP